jgi:creatinine amidohydrolase
VVNDAADSLALSGIRRVVIVNGHGGNYVLNNVVQEANVAGKRMALFPQPGDWQDARAEAGLQTSNHEDMHGGEAETSILLHCFPDVVHPGFESVDHLVDDRRHLLTEGMRPYAPDGIIGRPSLATADKGRRLLDAFSGLFKAHLTSLRDGQQRI